MKLFVLFLLCTLFYGSFSSEDAGTLFLSLFFNHITASEDTPDFSKLNLKELREILKDRDVQCFGCAEKSGNYRTSTSNNIEWYVNQSFVDNVDPLMLNLTFRLRQEGAWFLSLADCSPQRNTTHQVRSFNECWSFWDDDGRDSSIIQETGTGEGEHNGEVTINGIWHEELQLRWIQASSFIYSSSFSSFFIFFRSKGGWQQDWIITLYVVYLNKYLDH